MPSQARSAFDDNLKDIERLLALHQQEGGTLRGRRYGLEVLNKSAIVLITSYWEAYCEDIAAEALEHIVKYAKSSDALPKSLKKQIVKELEKDKDNNELAIWHVADDKWRDYLQSRLDKMQEERNRKLNTPKSLQVDSLFESAIGISKISSSWSWARSMNADRARIKLDKYVTLRGAIAHRGNAAKSVKRSEVEDYLAFIKTLAAKTGGKVNTYVKGITEKALWLRKRSMRRR